MKNEQLKPVQPIDIFESNLQPIGFFVTKAERKLAMWKQGVPDGRSTGFTQALDPYFRLVNSEYTLIAARPSMGKTSLVMQIAENVSYQLKAEGDPGVVAIFSAEMAGDELVIRMAAGLSGVNVHVLRNRPLDTYPAHELAQRQNDIQLMEESFDAIANNQHIWIDDGSGPTSKTMLDRLSELNEVLPVRLMIFDFAELSGDTGDTEELRLSAIHKSLKAIAKRLNIPVISLSQLNRKVEDRSDKMPQLADLRYSGMAEQLADRILFIMRPEYYIDRHMTVGDIPEDEKKGVAYILIAKTRNGPAGVTRKLKYIGARTRFEDMKQ